MIVLHKTSFNGLGKTPLHYAMEFSYGLVSKLMLTYQT